MIATIFAQADSADSATEVLQKEAFSISSKFNEYSEQGLDALVTYTPKIIISLLILWIGWKLSNTISNLLRKALEAKKVDASLIPFLTTILATVLKLSIGIAVIDYLGVKTTSFVAILGAAGLAVGMALSGTLQNFAGGVMLLIFRPFNVGDRIQAQDHVGAVKEIQIFQTLIQTDDNRSVFIPNGPLSTGNITNFHKEGNIRVEANIGISYCTDIDYARQIALEAIAHDDRLIENDPIVAVKELADSSVNLAIYVWTHPDNYWGVLFDTQENLKKAFDQANIKIPFPQREVHMAQG